jgi:hypothetical protein
MTILGRGILEKQQQQIWLLFSINILLIIGYIDYEKEHRNIIHDPNTDDKVFH